MVKMCGRMDWNGKRQSKQAGDSVVSVGEKAFVFTLGTRQGY